MVTFAHTTVPRDLRLERALRAMREVGTSTPPTPELYAELAERYHVTEAELGQGVDPGGLS